MNEKQIKLAKVKTIWELYENALRDVESLRRDLSYVVNDAHAYRATQQEIANQTKLSRQRIQQLLKEE